MVIGLTWMDKGCRQSYYVVLYFPKCTCFSLKYWDLIRSGAPPRALPHADTVHPEQGQGDTGVHAGSQVGPRTVAVRDGDKIVSDILHINFIVNIIQKKSLDAPSGQRGLGCCRNDDNTLHLYSILSQCLDVNRISNWWWAKRWEDIKIAQGRL